MAIISTAEFKAYRGITVSTFDTLIGSLITGAQGLLETDTGRKFETATYTDEAYHGTGTGLLQLRQYPVSALTAVKYRDDDGTSETQTIGDYRVQASTGLVARLGSRYGRVVTDDFGLVDSMAFAHSCPFPHGFDNVLVTYTAGHASDSTAPEWLALRQVMYEIVAEMYAQAGTQGAMSANGAMQSENMGDYSYTRADMAVVYARYQGRVNRFRRGVW